MKRRLQKITPFYLKKRLSFNTKKLLLSVFWSCWFCYSAFCIGQIDSLKQRLTELPDNLEKVDVLNGLSYAYHNNDIQQTFLYANKALTLADQLQYIKGKANAFHNLCIANSISGNAPVAVEFNEKAIHLADSIKAYRLLVETFRAKGIIQTKAANPEIAIQYFLKSYELATKENYALGIIYACFSLGNTYAKIDDFEEAKKYYEKAIAKGKSTGDNSSVAWGTRSIARIHHDEGQYKKAKNYYEKALKIGRQINEKRSLAFTLGDFANTLLKLGNEKLAEQYILESIEIIRTTGDIEGVVISLSDLANLYVDTNRPEKAIKVCEQAISLNKWDDTDESVTKIDLSQMILNIKGDLVNIIDTKNGSILVPQPLPTIYGKYKLIETVFKHLIENGLTYNESPLPIIFINYTKKQQEYVFAIKDNGIGIPKKYHHTVFEMFKRLQNREKYEGTGMGLSNCKKIVSKWGGKIWVASNGYKGTTFFFTLPIQQKNPTTIQSIEPTTTNASYLA